MRVQTNNLKRASSLLGFLTSPGVRRAAVYLLAFAVVALLAYNRYPVYWDTPNFYAEDGSIFAQNIIDKGFLGALFTSFNGYFIFGIYLLEGLAFLATDVFWGGNLLDLPQALGLVSYMSWAFLCTLPLLLFWNNVKRKSWLLLIAAALALLPLPGYNYAVFTVGNLKFAFVFVAFLLLIKRWQLPQNSRWVHAIDVSLVLCAFTNATVYLLLPFALLPYWSGFRQLRSKAFWKTLLYNRSFISLLILFALASLQLVYIMLRGGVEHIEGYMQEPYELAKTVELFLHRTLLFPFDHVIAKHLSDGIVVTAAIVFIFGLWKFARREDRRIVIFGLWTAFVATALFASQRTGVTRFFNDYTTSGPDHFFYAQNLIVLCTVLYVLARRLDIVKNKRLAALGALILCLVPLGSVINSDMGNAALINRETGSFRYSAQQACRQTTDNHVQVPVYPVSVSNFPLDRGTYCTAELEAFIPDRQPLPLKPFGGNYATLTDTDITQTFTAGYDKLSGISIFLSNFGGAGNSMYELHLMDKTCQATLRTAELRTIRVEDNTYVDVKFAPIEDSKNRQYCFTVTQRHLEQGKPSLAIQFSEPNIYIGGEVTKDGNPLSEDVVFDLLYR